MIFSSVPVDLTIARQIEVFYFIFTKERNNFFLFFYFFYKDFNAKFHDNVWGKFRTVVCYFG